MLFRHPRATAFLALAGILAIGWLVYLPAAGADFSLDDRSNLGALASIDDGLSALRFVFSGEAGPLGRPLALATFLPQAEAWTEGARSFIHVNILIHLCNGLLLAGLFRLLARVVTLPDRDAWFAALAAATIWLYLPLLASASLMVVQRMVTLSATFVLLGLNAYLLLRLRCVRPANLLPMTLVLAVAGLLAVFTKETGALLPVYVLVLEITLLTAPAGIGRRLWNGWRAVVLGLPTLLIVAYLAGRLPYPEVTVLARGFTGWERLLTEAGILWTYLGKAILPLPASISPINDAQAVAQSIWQPLALLAVLSWLVLVAAAAYWRRRFPLAALALFWFLGGHLLESTTLSLELYFDHRNYLPLAGPVFAMCAAALALPARQRRLARVLLPAFALFLCAMLYLQTSLWGQPSLAARTWYQQNPDSVRAATLHATRQLADDGVPAALGTLHAFVNRHPEHAYLLIQDLNITCRLAPERDHSDQVDALAGLLGTVTFTQTSSTMLSELFHGAVRGAGCSGLGTQGFRQLARALRANPRYRKHPRHGSQHHQLMALSYRSDGNTDLMLDHLERAEAIGAERDVVPLRILALAQAGRFDAAREALGEARDASPWHPVREYLWERELGQLAGYIGELEAARQ